MEYKNYAIRMPENKAEEYQNFTQAYVLQSILETSTKSILGKTANVKKRICRFCDKKYPEVNFSNDAHVIPEQMGGAKAISHFECDNCNKEFSILENDLSRFLSIDKALYAVKGKKGTTKFKTPNGTVIHTIQNIDEYLEPNPDFKKKAKKIIPDNANIIFLQQDKEEKEIKMDLNNHKIEFNLTIPSYSPLNVFTVFLKIGISMLPIEELVDFKFTIKALKMKVEQEDPHPLFDIFIQQLPVWKNIFKMPTAYLYQKINKHSEFIDKTLVIYFINKIYQIFIPSDKTIISHFKEKKPISRQIVSPYLNPFFSKEMFENKIFINLIENTSLDIINLAKSSIEKNGQNFFSLGNMNDLISETD